MALLLRNLIALATMAASGAAQVEYPSPSPVPNPHFPAELSDGIQFRVEVSAISPHTRGATTWSAGGTSISNKFSEIAPNDSTNTWYSVEVAETLSSTISAVSSREGGRNIYIGTIDLAGTVRIHNFQYGVRANGWALSAPTPPLVLGQSMPPFMPTEGLNGGTWAPPTSGMGRPAVRSVLWTSNNSEVLAALAVDPEGRYLLALTYPSGNVLRFSLGQTPLSAPVLVLDASTFGYLQGATTMVLRQHASEGRKCLITKRIDGWADDDQRLMLTDAANDGTFEAHVLLDSTAWEAAGYDEQGVLRKMWSTGIPFNWDE